MKKYRRTPISIICYVIAALLLIYTIYVGSTTVATIVDYYSSYDMAPQAGEFLTYLMQNCLMPFVSSILIGMAGFILDAVRKADPANWLTDEELSDAKEAKKAAKLEAKAAKLEAKAAKAETAKKDEDEDEDPVSESTESEEGAVFSADTQEDKEVIEFKDLKESK